MISLQKVGDAIKFTFQDNPLYLNDGTIEVPVNSLSLLIDESDIATFKKSNGDAFLCCSLDELNMTKEQLIAFYKDNMVGDEGMTPEEVEDIVESATTNLFGYAEYDSQNTRINFKHDSSGSVITYIDASDFVIDGMIDNVEIVTVQGVKYLKITFNTESGKEPILIPLSDIFNPDDYYTKSEVDTALSGKLDTSVFEEKERVVASSLTDLDERKLDASAYTPTDLSNYYTKSETNGEINAAVSGKSDTVELTQAEYDALVDKDPNTFYIISDADPININNYYTKSETDGKITAAVSGKQETLVSGTNIKTINNTSILGSGNIDIQGGGGKAVSGGTNISITTGETADTINCTLPITNIQGFKSVIIGDSRNTVRGDDNVAVGYQNSIIPNGSSYIPNYCFVGGEHNNVYNYDETAFGKYNNSVQNTSVVGESGTTLFSVGNGKSNNARHNAFEIRQNGDIYCSDGTSDVKLQDTITATAANTAALGGLSLIKLTQAEYDALVTKDSNTLYVITES